MPSRGGIARATIAEGSKPEQKIRIKRQTAQIEAKSIALSNSETVVVSLCYRQP